MYNRKVIEAQRKLDTDGSFSLIYKSPLSQDLKGRPMFRKYTQFKLKKEDHAKIEWVSGVELEHLRGNAHCFREDFLEGTFKAASTGYYQNLVLRTCNASRRIYCTSAFALLTGIDIWLIIQETDKK